MAGRMYEGVPLVDPLNVPPSSYSVRASSENCGYIAQITRSKGSYLFEVKHASASFKRWQQFSIAFVCAVTLACAGGLFIRFYAVPLIGEYINYPQTNCTVLAFDLPPKATDYSVDVTYIDESGERRNKTISVPEEHFHWNVGDSFVCLNKGNFLAPYDAVQSEVTDSKKNWFWGFLIPLGGVFLLSAMYIFRSTICRCSSFYFPSDISMLGNDGDFVVTDWSTIPTTYHRLFYVLLVALHAFTETAPKRQISFTEPKQQKRHIAAFLPLILFIGGPLGLLIGGITCFNGYEFSQYLGGEFMVSLFCAMTPFCIPLSYLFIATYHETHAGGFHITYRVSSNSISGSVYANKEANK